MSYVFSELPDPHIDRRRQMLKKYPEAMRKLMGNEPRSAAFIVGLVALQFAMAWFLRDQPVWVVLVSAFCVGAFANHALYVLVHECAHNLVFKSSIANRWIAMVADFPLVAPSAMAFRKYHLVHHFRMGQMEFDADLTGELEGKLVGNSAWRKLVWVALLGVSQAMRPMRVSKDGFWDRWILTNLAVQLVAMTATVYLIGWSAIGYFLASSLMGLGLHPLGARWIAEHYITTPGIETYSYYGPLNRVMFNVGYHTEHHDIMTIPWTNLPELRRIAPEYYANLPSYASYTALLVRFIRDPKLDLFSRMTRSSRPIEAVPEAPFAYREVSVSSGQITPFS
jgi:sphingolipid delta-4 desaturase